MKKAICATLFILVLLGIASVQAAGVPYSFENIGFSLEIPTDFTVVTKEDFNTQSDSFEAMGISKESLQTMFEVENVYLFASNADASLRIKFTAEQNDVAQKIFNVDEQTPQVRGGYRTSFFPRNEYEYLGYNYKSSTWTNLGKKAGRFLVLNYSHFTDGTKDYTGLARRSIKNGYELCLDLMVYDAKQLKNANKLINKITKSFSMDAVDKISTLAAAGVNITTPPSKETRQRKINISGTATSGTSFTAVVMSLGAEKPDIVKVDATDKNKFNIPISFSKQGVFLITLTALREGKEVGEWAFPVTFKEGLLSVEFDEEIPSVVFSNSLKIKGKAEPGANIQVLLNDRIIDNKRAASDGSFSINIDTSVSGEYNLILSFSKKSLQNRRFKFSFSRSISKNQEVQNMIKQAAKPTYERLYLDAHKYASKIITMNLYIVDQNENTITFAKQKNNNVYEGILYAIKNGVELNKMQGDKVQVFAEVLGKSNDFIGQETFVPYKENNDNLPVIKLLHIGVS